MQHNIILLLLSLGIILLGCELFTNGIEWLGRKLKFGDGVVGSVFSAVGTCLPETLVPIIALFFTKNRKDSVEIGLGAIVGAPFMLATLAFFITGLSAILFSKRRKSRFELNVNLNIIGRDLSFFIVVYFIAITTSFLSLFKEVVAILLILGYIYYIVRTVKGDKVSNNEIDELIFAKTFKVKTSRWVILLQVIVALSSIIFGAQLFVGNLELTAKTLGVSTLVLSMIITPIATELPEKFNSVIWVSKGKDTLALGNITGAMAFQSCIPVALGMLATGWKLNNLTIFSALLALAPALIAYIWIRRHKKLGVMPLLTGGLFYIIFILYLVLVKFK